MKNYVGEMSARGNSEAFLAVLGHSVAVGGIERKIDVKKRNPGEIISKSKSMCKWVASRD